MELVTRNGNRKVDEQMKDEIVRMYNAGSRQKDIAERFSISVSTVQKVCRERRRKEAI